MTIYRVKHNKNYTTINNTICKDKRLSWKARGLWLYAFSRPDDWNFHINDLVNQGTDGRDSVRAGLKELEDCGYLIRTQDRDENKKFTSSEWVFFETPREIKENFPQPDFPSSEKPLTENPPLLSTDCLLSTEEEQQQQTPAKPADGAVFSCLEKIEIPWPDKIWICKHYDENTVHNAIAYALHPQTIIKKSLVQALKWACENQPEIPQDSNEIESANRKYAEEKEAIVRLKKGVQFNLWNLYAEFVFIAQRDPIVLYYNQKDFKSQLDKALEKMLE